MVTKDKGSFNLIVGVVIAAAVLLVGLAYYTYNSQEKSSMKINQVKTDTSPKELETEASSIQLEDVDSGLSDIDKDLKELK